MDNFRHFYHFIKCVLWYCIRSWSKIYAFSWSKYPLFVAILEVFVWQRREKPSAHVSKELPIRIGKSKLILRTRTRVFTFFAQRILLRSLQKVHFYFTINHIDYERMQYQWTIFKTGPECPKLSILPL